MFSEAFAGVGYLLRGMRLLALPGVKRFVAIPLAINIVVFALLLWLAAGEFDQLVERFTPRLPEWLAWLTWLSWIVFGLATVVVVFFTFTLVANLIAAPVNGLLAEAVERHLTGQGPSETGGLKAALLSAPTQILDEIRKLGYYLRWAVPLLILFFIPGLNLIAPFLWALFGAWMMAVQYADYPLGNHGLRGAEQRQVLKKTRFVALGFGGATMVATLIPIVNFFVVPAAVSGATAMVVERLRTQRGAKA